MSALTDQDYPSCPNCGSSAYFEECPDCEEGIEQVDWGDDVISYYVDLPCRTCGGDGGWWRCMSSPEWCAAHPLKADAA